MASEKVRVNGGEYSVITRKDGRFESKVWNPFLKKQTSVYANDKTELKRKIRDKIISMSQSKIDPTKDSVNEYMTKWLYTYKITTVRRTSFDTNERMFRRYISPIIGEMKFKDIGDTELQNVLNTVAEKFAFSTVKKTKEVLQQCWSFAYNRGDIERNPMTLVKTPKEEMCGKPTKQICIYTEPDLKKMLAVIIDYYESNHYYRVSPIFIFLANTGLRIGEALALTFDDLDVENRTITVNKTISRIKCRDKNNTLKKREGMVSEYVITPPKTQSSNRIVDLNSTALWAIEEVQRRNKDMLIPQSKYIFCSETGNFFNPRSIEDTLKRVCIRARLPYYGLHALRHTFASRCFEKGIAVEVVSKILGHANPTITTKIYIHILPHVKRMAVNILDEETQFLLKSS